MESVHVQLSHKRSEVVVFEVVTQDLVLQCRIVGDDERLSVLRPVDPRIRLRGVDHAIQLVQKSREGVLFLYYRGEERPIGGYSSGDDVAFMLGR